MCKFFKRCCFSGKILLMLKKLLILISGFLVIFIIEVFARRIYPYVKLRHAHIEPGIGGKDVLEYTSLYIKDKELFWRLDPNLKWINSFGCRGKEINIHKKKGVIRIVCLGDSVTFGNITTYPDILSKLLKIKFAKKKFEVINAGVPGYSSYQGLKWLQKDIIKLKPDILIVYYGLNDAGPAFTKDREQKTPPSFIVSLINLLNKTYSFKLLMKLIYYFKYNSQAEYNYTTQRVPPDEYRNNLIKMKKIMEKIGGKALFIANPTYYNPKNGYVFTRSEYFPPQEVDYIDLYSLFKEKEKEAYKLFYPDTTPYYFHLSPQGQELLAYEILKFIIKKKFFSICYDEYMASK